MNNTIIYLIGHYGVGKLTVAREICAATDARLFDNHLANNVIFSLIREDGATPIPEMAWHLIGVIREQAFIAMTDIAPGHASFVLTNALFENDPLDRPAYERVLETAQKRGSTFVPVILGASEAAHDARVGSPERHERLKLTDIEAGRRKRQSAEILRIDHPNRLDLDTSDIPAAETARRIIDYAEALA